MLDGVRVAVDVVDVVFGKAREGVICVVVVEFAEHALEVGDRFRLEFGFHGGIARGAVEVVPEHPVEVCLVSFGAGAVQGVAKETMASFQAHVSVEHVARFGNGHVVLFRQIRYHAVEVAVAHDGCVFLFTHADAREVEDFWLDVECRARRELVRLEVRLAVLHGFTLRATAADDVRAAVVFDDAEHILVEEMRDIALELCKVGWPFHDGDIVKRFAVEVGAPVRFRFEDFHARVAFVCLDCVIRHVAVDAVVVPRFLVGNSVAPVPEVFHAVDGGDKMVCL